MVMQALTGVMSSTMSSTSSSSKSSTNPAPKTKRRLEAVDDDDQEEHTLRDLAYSDLWSPIRFAVPSTHPIEVEFSERRLEGDAEIVGWGRMGPCYRKTIQNRDVVVKLLAFCARKESRDDPDPGELREEMRHEFDVYRRLEALQGITIPRLMWYGELVEGAADAIATEYCGKSLEGEEFESVSLSDAQKTGVWRALKSLHDHGVLHGDAELKNFVWDGKRVHVLDFGFAQFEEEYGEAEWKRRLSEESEAVRRMLRWTEEVSSSSSCDFVASTTKHGTVTSGVKRKREEELV